MRPLKDVRLFFALWPNDGVREQICRNLELFDLDDSKLRLIDSRNFHLTLHFIGNTSFSEMECLVQQADQTRSEAFDLTLDCSGYFKKPKVLWFGCLEPPGELFELQRRLGRQIETCAFMPESRPYNPHVTVARKLEVKPKPMPHPPIHWTVDHFALIQSIPISRGVRYQVVEKYALDDP